MTQTCHVCGRQRPDDKISVSPDLRSQHSGGEHTVRFCSDAKACGDAVRGAEMSLGILVGHHVGRA
jgi:hypothetical protein